MSKKDKNKDKVVIITGASSGIGLANAKRFIANGFKVYGIAYSEFSLEGLTYYQSDIRDTKRVNEIIDEIWEKEGRIDYLINCAGMGISGSVENTPTEDLRYMFDVNFFGTVETTKAVIPYMRKTGGGRIATMSSVASFLPIAFQTFYSANKAAINMYTEGLRIELKPFNIHPVVFLPGDAQTGFTDNRRKNKKDDEAYGDRIEKSVEVMEHDERTGMTADYVAKVMYKNLTKRRPPVRKIVGKRYKYTNVLYRILPLKFVNWVMYKLYG